MSTVTEPLTMAAAVATGLIAGLFFFCSVALMPALARLDQSAGIRAMQAINIVIIRPLFLLVFLGAAVATGVLALLAPEPLHLVAAACYLIGVIVVTATANIPLNNALDAVAADSCRGGAAVAALPVPLDGLEPRAHPDRDRRHPGPHPCLMDGRRADDPIRVRYLICHAPPAP